MKEHAIFGVINTCQQLQHYKLIYKKTEKGLSSLVEARNKIANNCYIKSYIKLN